MKSVNAINDEIFIDDPNLSGLENDILYYIHKHYALTPLELQFLFKLDKNTMRNYLNKLLNESSINKLRFRNNIIYFQYNENNFFIRKECIVNYIIQCLNEGALTEFQIFQLLKRKQICFDSSLIQNLIQDATKLHTFYEDGKKYVYHKTHQYNKKIIYCPHCSAIIIKGICRYCNYKMPFRKKNLNLHI